MNIKNNFKLSALVVLASLFITSCKDDEKDPAKPQHEHNTSEIITTVKLILTDSLNNQITATWKDADGDGPAQPDIEPIQLVAGKSYTGYVLLLDESKSPVDTISHEVEEEADAHQFFYVLGGDVATQVSITKLDEDEHNLPVGLNFSIKSTSSNSGVGSLKVILKHYDGISKSNDVTIGETDVEAEFPVSIQ
jgi:hypothetical protein